MPMGFDCEVLPHSRILLITINPGGD